MLDARFSRGVRTGSVCAAAGCALALCGPANAAMTLRMDLNSIVVEAGGGFDGLTHTGALSLSVDADSYLTALRIDGVDQESPAAIQDLEGEILLANGQVVGGDFMVTLSDGARYGASIENTIGDVTALAWQGFTVDGLTGQGDFGDLESGTDFGGVDVSPWLTARGQLPGSFYLFAFDPNGQGVDSDTDLEIYLTVVPSPGSVALGALAMAYGGIRRRRSA